MSWCCITYILYLTIELIFVFFAGLVGKCRFCVFCLQPNCNDSVITKQGCCKSSIWQVKSKSGSSQVRVQEEQLLESSPSPTKPDSSPAGLVAALLVGSHNIIDFAASLLSSIPTNFQTLCHLSNSVNYSHYQSISSHWCQQFPVFSSLPSVVWVFHFHKMFAHSMCQSGAKAWDRHNIKCGSSRILSIIQLLALFACSVSFQMYSYSITWSLTTII